MIIIRIPNLVATVHLAVYNMDEPRRLSRPQCAQDWEDEDRKDIIMELYGSKTLKETMRIMEEEHLFKATYVPTTYCFLYTHVVQRETVQDTVAEVGYRP